MPLPRPAALLFLLALAVPAKTPPVNACVAHNMQVCVLDDLYYNRRDNRIYFTFTNPTDDGARSCIVRLFLMGADRNGQFYRVGVAHGMTDAPVRPHDRFRMEATPMSDSWLYADTGELQCDGGIVNLRLTYPVFTDWIIERRLRKRLGY